MGRVLAVADRWVERVARGAVTLALAALMLLLALGIFFRAVPVFSMAGYDEVIELLMAWMTFLGAAALWREGALYRVDVLADWLPPRPARLVALGVRLLMLLFALVFTVEGWALAARAAETTPFLRFPKSLAYASMPVAGLLMAIYGAAALCPRSPAPPPGERAG